MRAPAIYKTAVLALSLGLVVAIFAPGASAQAQKPPDTVTMTGAPMGGVRMNHKLHVTEAKTCETCHHASRPERPHKTPQQACGDCHTSKVAAPMKTNARDAFHDATGKKGLCIDCHAKVNAAGKAAPMKCLDCHKKDIK